MSSSQVAEESQELPEVDAGALDLSSVLREWGEEQKELSDRLEDKDSMLKQLEVAQGCFEARVAAGWVKVWQTELS